MLFCPAALPLLPGPSPTPPGSSARHRRRTGSCWHMLDPGRQALLVLAYLRKGEMFAGLAGGFGNGPPVYAVHRRLVPCCVG